MVEVLRSLLPREAISASRVKAPKFETGENFLCTRHSAFPRFSVAPNRLQSPEQQLGTMKAGVLSPTGTCHTFVTISEGLASNSIADLAMTLAEKCGKSVKM